MSDHQHPAKRGLAGVLFLLALTCSARASESSIPQADITKAEKLFSGPTEEDLYRTDEMLVSATGSLKPVVLAPSVATVISKEEIEAMGARSLNEVLETVPGLHVAPSSLVGPLFTNYSIRGILTTLNPQVQVLLNGYPLKEIFNGNRNYRFNLPIEMISRIEVVRGPGSALFGADAFSGTINIITKDGQEVLGVRAGLRHGSFDASDLWVQFGQNQNGWDVVASFEAVKKGSDSSQVIDADLQTGLDNAFATSASMAPGAMNLDYESVDFHLGVRKDEWSARFFGRQLRDAGVGVGVAAALDPGGRVESERYLFELKHEAPGLFPYWRVDSGFHYEYFDLQTNYSLLPPGALVPIGNDGNLNPVTPVGLTLFSDGVLGNPGGQGQKYSLETAAIYDGKAQHKMRFALGFTREDSTFRESKNFGPGILDGTQTVVDGSLTNVTGTAFIYTPDVKRDIWFVSAQDEWALTRKWELTAGVRYDHYSDFGGTVNPRAALVWQTRYDLVTKLLYGRAFRAPTLSELYAKNTPVNTGNPELDPETIDTFELAFDYRPTVDVILKLNLFRYNIKDLIELVPDPASGSTTQVHRNARDQQGYGSEFEVDWEASRQVRVQANLAWQRSEDKASGNAVPDTPQLQAYANVNWKFLPKWSVDSQWFWIGKRKRAAGDSRSAIADYSTVNLTLRRKDIVRDVDVALAVRNVFDKDRREPSAGPVSSIPNDYPLEGRAVWAELRGRF